MKKNKKERKILTDEVADSIENSIIVKDYDEDLFEFFKNLDLNVK